MDNVNVINNTFYVDFMSLALFCVCYLTFVISVFKKVNLDSLFDGMKTLRTYNIFYISNQKSS